MIEGEVEVLEIDALPQQRGDRFAARTGFDPRAPTTPARGERARARFVARVLEEWSAVSRVFHRAPRPILTELKLSPP